MDNENTLYNELLKLDGIEPDQVSDTERDDFRVLLEAESKRVKRMGWLVQIPMWVFIVVLMLLCMSERLLGQWYIPVTVTLTLLMATVVVTLQIRMARRLRAQQSKIRKIKAVLPEYDKQPPSGVVIVGTRDGKRIIRWPDVITLTLIIWLVITLGANGVYYLLCRHFSPLIVPISFLMSVVFVAAGVCESFKTPLKELTEVKPITPSIWRRIMKSRIGKLTTVAAVVVIAALSIVVFDRSITPAYAITQTIEAGQDLRHLHFKYFFPSPSRGKIWKEAWLEYNSDGEIENVRVDFYSLKQEHTLNLVMVWNKGKTQMWQKKDKRLQLFEDEIYTAKIIKFVKGNDPTSSVEYMHELQEKGDVSIEIEEPIDIDAAIVVTVTYEPNTYLIEGPMPKMRDVLFVDRNTKLITSKEVYELVDGKYVDRGAWKYDDYDIPFDPNVFDLEQELPADVKIIDMMKLDVGLEVGDGLTKEEIAVKVTHEFFEALIAKDYDRAVKIHGYNDPDRKQGIREQLESLKVVGIFSIGETFAPPLNQSRGSIGISCTIEVEEDGHATACHLDSLFVSRAIGHPNRWCIKGKFKCQ